MNSEAGYIKSVLNEKFNLFSILKGIFIAYVITIPMFVIFAYILSLTSYPQKLITPVVMIVTIISILVAGSVVTKSIRSRGWMNGAIVGFVYMAILYVISSIVFGTFSVDTHSLIVAAIGIFTGIIGGIIGVNVSKTKRQKYKRI